MLCDDLEGWIGGGVGRREGRCIYIATDIYRYIYIYIYIYLIYFIVQQKLEWHCQVLLESLIGKFIGV